MINAKLIYDTIVSTQPEFISAVMEAQKSGGFVLLSGDNYSYFQDDLMVLGACIKFANDNGVLATCTPMPVKNTVKHEKRLGERRKSLVREFGPTSGEFAVPPSDERDVGGNS